MGFLNAPTFDPNNKGASITLSGSNLISTVTSGTGVAGTINRISGKVYYEFTIGATLTGTSSLGLFGTQQNLGLLLGTDVASTSVGYANSGTVKLNNVTLSTIATYTAGNNVGVAVDPVNKLIWFRVNGGNWNNDVIANQNPVGPVGGISLSGLDVANMTAAWSGSATSSATYLPTSATWSFTAPTGYSDMNTLQATAMTFALPKGIPETVPTTQIVIIGGTISGTSNSPVPVGAVLPPGQLGIAYSETITAEGGVGPYTFAVTIGSPPSGLSLNSTTGVISGTPLAIVGPTLFTITATDSTGHTGQTQFSIEITAASSGSSNIGFAA